MRILILITTALITFGLITLQVTANLLNVTDDLYERLNERDSTTTAAIKVKQKNVIRESVQKTSPAYPTMTSSYIPELITEKVNIITSTSLPSSPTPLMVFPLSEAIATSTTSASSSSSSPLATLPTSPSAKATPTPTEDPSPSLNQYCSASLCEFYNGSHINVKPHIACKNSGNFGPACGLQPHLLKMSERRRNLILDLHNLARSRIASGQVDGYKSASHMPQLKWDNELEYLASLHVKLCRFEHDLCHNTPRFPYSGQNMGYFWKGANITSHSKRMKSFIVNWYNEQKDANQSFIDSFHLHPDKKTIDHFTVMIGDRVHHVGCAVIRFYESYLTQILMTCNYDYKNFLDEPIYQTGPTASKCAYNISDKYPGLCDWKVPAYEYETEEDDVHSSGNFIYRI